MSITQTAPVATRTSILSLRGVTKNFGAVAALTDIDLDVAPGEVVAIVGDNGAGKSTLVKVLSGVHSPDAGTITFESETVTIPSPSRAIDLGIATVFQDLALCDNLNVIDNLFLGRELRPGRLDEVAMEVRSWELLRQLSAKIPSVRIPVASLSGGQRQTVAIARSLLGEPKVIILDEPTAALGVAQTAEVLNLVERLRERGLGVIMISHNMADVQAVADRVVVLRLGRNNGDFRVDEVTPEDVIAAITGATDNAVSRRSSQVGRRAASGALPDAGPLPDIDESPDTDTETAHLMSTEITTQTAPTDRQDERLRDDQGIRGTVSSLVDRVRGGDLGVLPVVIGLVVIWGVLQYFNRGFLSSANLVNLLMESAAVGIIALGIVCVLLVAQIDLSVGSVSGLSSAILGVLFVNAGLNVWLAVLIAVATGAAIGWVYGQVFNRFGVPSFVITLAGLLSFLGLQLFVLRGNGTINLPFDSPVVNFAQLAFVPAWLSYLLVLLAGAALFATDFARARSRRAASLSAVSTRLLVIKAVVVVVVLELVAYYLNQARGIGWMFVLFIALVLVLHYFLSRTGWGRAVYAVGGNVEAARRAGINVRFVYTSVFVLCSSLAAVGGILAASRLAASSQSSGTGDVNLNAIAAAVIGGTSLFGGRGKAFAALLGIIVIQSISSGLTLMNLDSSFRFIVTGLVLLLAVMLDSLSRRSRATHGRA